MKNLPTVGTLCFSSRHVSVSCCEAVRTIDHQCWLALLGTLGFTAEETDVLKGYCDEADHVKSPPANPPSPPSIHDPRNVKVFPDLEKLVP
ncbi:egg cell-secreted protein 1.1 [Prunus yedoensis var. nudiflora]|uniref:Egg cell-secreted protein 1.1 n=1 Tax=Prunus yedoensis var. nudiflora TaxID=2094558 RepID=A0A314XX97_PRUYE|nr:egg cell-secreted protein 1.1 [Prunus yedoensis var. nudiflora]